jgi:pimeloyl-ACP methyl ester carboxylesterase
LARRAAGLAGALGEAVDPRGGGGERDAVAGLAGADRRADRRMGLAGAGRAPDFPTGHTQEEQVAWQAALDEGWGTEEYTRALLKEGAPGMAADADRVRWYAKRSRYGASPGEALAFDNVWYATDVRAVLPSVRVPTLVVARDGFDAVSESRQVAEWIPGARLAVVPGRDRPLISDVQDRFLQELRASWLRCGTRKRSSTGYCRRCCSPIS